MDSISLIFHSRNNRLASLFKSVLFLFLLADPILLHNILRYGFHLDSAHKLNRVPPKHQTHHDLNLYVTNTYPEKEAEVRNP